MSDKTFDRRAIVVQLVMVGLALLGAWYMINMAFNRLPPAAATTYDYPVITTNNRPLCPGDKVAYDQNGHFTAAPVMVRVVTTVWSVDRNITLHEYTSERPVNYFEPTTVNLDSEWTIPATVPPGNYRLLRSATAEGRQTQMFAVTFTVAEDCQ